MMIGSLGVSQMLGNSQGQLFGDQPEFVFDFIRTHKIKTIVGHYATKAELDYIRPSDDILVYQFNRAGELGYEYRIQGVDTIITVYVYDERSNLIEKRRSDRYSFVSNHYRYDDQNRLIYSELRREENARQNRFTHVPGESAKMSSEKFAYEDFDNGNYKKIYYNDGGSVYMEEFFYFDGKGRLSRQEGVLKAGSGRTNTSYLYNDAGQLVEKYSESTVMGTYTSKQVYEYDEWGNILAQHTYKDGVYVMEFQILYDAETQHLKAIISREHATNFMTILTLKDYTFFD
jgi:hypothetical protein